MQKIESVRELASNLGINPNTVKKAYDELERRNIITTFSTKGTFISEDIRSLKELKIEQKIKKIRDEISELEILGISKEEILKRLWKKYRKSFYRYYK